jgi:hypothetical protein
MRIVLRPAKSFAIFVVWVVAKTLLEYKIPEKEQNLY